MHPASALTAALLGGALVLVATPASAAPVSYKNCTELHKSYPHGIGRANAKDHVSGTSKPVTTFKKDTKGYELAIKHNKQLDADKDGIACEKA